MGLKNTRLAQMSVGHTADDDRPAADFYDTCPEAVRGLLAAEKLYKTVPIWEPACGTGAISTELDKAGYITVSSDLYDRGYGLAGVDFLQSDEFVAEHFADGPLYIITNPPFSAAEKFAWKANEIIARRAVGKVALLNRLQWLEGIKRRRMFIQTELARVWVFSRRIPRMHRPGYDGKKSSSLIAFAWFIWDNEHTGPPSLGWIDWKGV